MKVELKKTEPKTLEERIKVALVGATGGSPFQAMSPTLAASVAASVASSPVPPHDPYPVTLTVTLESEEEALALRAFTGLVGGDYIAHQIKTSPYSRDYEGITARTADVSTRPIYDALFALTHK